MNYLILAPDQLDTLIRERISALEAEHFKRVLMVAEHPENSAQAESLFSEIADLERRIAIHAPRISQPPLSRNSRPAGNGLWEESPGHQRAELATTSSHE